MAAGRFTFRLQTVLRVRELREREARRKVDAKAAEIARIDQWNRETADEVSRIQRAIVERQMDPQIDVRELTRQRAWVAHLRRTIVERQVAKQSLVAQLEALRGDLRTARTQMRVIEKLRERRFGEWKREHGLAEQAAMDEVARQLHGRDSQSWTET